MRIKYPKQPLEDFEGEERFAGVHICYHDGKVYAFAIDGRCAAAVPMEASEEEIAFAKARPEMAFTFTAEHWKTIRKADLPFQFELQTGGYWNVKLIDGRTLPVAENKASSVAYMIDNVMKERGKFLAVKLVANAMQLTKAVKVLAVAKLEPVEVSMFEDGQGPFAVTSKATPGCTVVVMPWKGTQIFERGSEA